MSMQSSQKIRAAVYSGSWYTGNKEKLIKEIDSYFEKAAVEKTDDRVTGIISPHAGYAYSGQAAAYGYKALKGQDVDRVILLAPSHRYPIMGLAYGTFTQYETPIGLIPVDLEAQEKIKGKKFFSENDNALKSEHSLELQLPMLQRSIENFKLVPFVVGEVSGDMYQEISAALNALVTPKTLIIASSDFTHYGSNYGFIPFRDNIKKNLEKLDLGAVDFILGKDQKGFTKYVEQTGATICGRAPIAILLTMLGSDQTGKKLTYYTSGDITGDFNNSVSYVSLVFTQKISDKTKETRKTVAKEEQNSALLNTDEQDSLLRLARKTLEQKITKGDVPDGFLKELTITPKLNESRGVFVTLEKKGMLRGCIGYIKGIEPLVRAVMDNTVNAALKDPRFPAVSADELKDISIEITVLTPLKLIEDTSVITIGKHGIYIKKGFYSGLLLPQVASERSWSRETFLEQTCYKAGLPGDAWKKGAEIYIFEGQIFHEK